MNRQENHKILRSMMVIYTPVVNVIYICILAFGIDMNLTLNHQAYLLYAASVPIMYMLSFILQMCNLYRFSLVNPLIAPMMMLVTPETYNAVIGKIAMLISAYLVIMMIVRFCKNKKPHKNELESCKD